MTVAAASLDRFRKCLTFISDSRISGSASTESGAKIFSLPVAAVAKKKKGGFYRVYRTSFGFAFSGSTLSALNTLAFATGCLQNLVADSGSTVIPLRDVAEFVALVAERNIKDVVSRSSESISGPSRYFFNALLGGYCDKQRAFELYQIQPLFDGNAFSVNAYPVELEPGRFFPIGSGTDALLRANEIMIRLGYQRGVYGALELLIALNLDETVGGWIQCGKAERGGFKLVPVMHPDLHDADAPFSVTMCGADTSTIGKVGLANIGYEIIGPEPPVEWLAEAYPRALKLLN